MTRPAPSGGAPDCAEEIAVPAVAPGPSLSEVQDAFRDTARTLSGFGGEEDRRSLRQVLRDGNLSALPLVALVTLGAAQALTSEASAVLQPEIARTFGVGPTFSIVTAFGVQAVALFVPLLTSYIVRDRPWRATVTVITALLYAVAVLVSGFAPSLALLAVFMLLDAATSSANNTVSGSLAIDLYPPAARVRVFSFQFAAAPIAGVGMGGLVVLLTGPAHLTWRGVYLVAGIFALLLTLSAFWLRDPGYGFHDREQIGAALREHLEEIGETVPSSLPKHAHPSFAEVYRSLWAVPTMRLSLIGAVVAGLSAPLSSAIYFYLAAALDFSSAELAVQALLGNVAMLAGLVLLAPLGDRIFRRSPKRLYWISSGLSMLGSLAVLIQLAVDSKVTAMAVSVVGMFLSSFIGPAAAVGGMSVIPPEQRHYSGSAFAIAMLAGTGVGTAIFAAAARQASLSSAIIAVVVASVIGAVFNGLAGNEFLAAVDDGNDRLVEDIVARSRLAGGAPSPVLECHKLSYSYGRISVLHELDLRVEEGEIFGLLGLNGSGKSTLLRAVAGLGMPDSGTVRLDGYDITRASVERRVASGIVLMSGGHAVFRSLTVAENLRVAASSLPPGQRRRRFDDAFVRFEALRQLSERRAALLSGGEAQMLGLARAFVLRPRLLMIDELSLGLAPRVVGELVQHVRDLNAEGVTVLVVEQSINLATRLAHRAAFLERGQVRFCGSVSELARRDDLLRAVFLRGEV